MRTVITGVTGRIGTGIAAALKSKGHCVVGLDVSSPSHSLCERFFPCDLAKAAEAGSSAHEALLSACEGADVVVHCAAWPGPSASPPPAVRRSGSASTPEIGLEDTSPAVLLRDNVAATSAVCDAAVGGGATRVVFSSSAFAIGYGHAARGPQALQPRYLPIDEAHGATPLETYGLSKLCGEGVLETAARTALSTSFVSLRFPNIIKRERWAELPWPAPTAEAPLTMLLWAYAHEDDVIDAHVVAATRHDAAAAGAHEAYIIAAPDTRFAEPTLELLASSLRMEADSTPLRFGAGGAAAMGGNASPLDSSKAVARLGWSPRSWQQPASPFSPPPPAPPAYGLGARAAHRALGDGHLRHFDLSGFPLGSGATLPSGATLAYRVHGPPAGEGKGVILHPTSFDAVHDELEYNIGEGRTVCPPPSPAPPLLLALPVPTPRPFPAPHPVPNPRPVPAPHPVPTPRQSTPARRPRTQYPRTHIAPTRIAPAPCLPSDRPHTHRPRSSTAPSIP